MLSIIWMILKGFITGEIFKVYAAHKQKQQAQAVANAPLTDQEEADGLLK